MAKVGDTKTQDTDPGSGWEPAGQNNQGINIWKYVGTGGTSSDGDGSSGGTSSGGTSSGSSGSSGSADDGLSPYVQAYRLNFFANGTPPGGMVQRAKDGNWSVAYFLQQVRLNDKNYYKSNEARRLLPEFTKTMKVLFPGLSDKNRQAALMKSKFYRQTAMWYLREGVGLKKNGEELLYSRITNTRRWKQANPYWKQYVKNRDPSVAVEANPMLYKAHLDTLRTAFKEYGMELPDDYYRAFFKSRYASQDSIGEMQDNLKTLAQGKGSFEWFEGRQTTSSEAKQTIFGGAEQSALKGRLAKAFGVKSSFLGSEEGQFGTQMSERGKLTKPGI